MPNLTSQIRNILDKHFPYTGRDDNRDKAVADILDAIDAQKAYNEATKTSRPEPLTKKERDEIIDKYWAHDFSKKAMPRFIEALLQAQLSKFPQPEQVGEKTVLTPQEFHSVAAIDER